MGLSTSQKALLNRWDTFLGRLEQRSEELRTEAGTGMQSLIDDILAADPIETRAVHNAISGIEGRLKNLPNKVDKAWEDEAESLFEDENEDYDSKPDIHDMGHDRKDDCMARLESALERFKLRWGTHLYRQMWPAVEAGLKEVAECTQCGNALAGIDRRFPARVPCPSCGAVNQVLPPQAVATYRAEAPTQFALEAARAQREAIEEYRVKVDRQSRANDWAPEPIESMDHRESMEREYWTKYATVYTQTGWEQASKADELVKSRMEMFRRQALMTDQRWRRAKGL